MPSEITRVPDEFVLVDGRVLWLSAAAVAIGVVAGYIAYGLVWLIDLFTNLSFYGTLSAAPASPALHHLGYWVLMPPVLGGVVVGVMARYGSKAIRGHGIPEAMEHILTNGSRIPPRVLILKPLSTAIAIGTGGPFGAEGPIIATGGALGSLVGQLFTTTAFERKTLLAAGAAAGMTAIFGSPVSAVLLAIELLLFEFRPRSVIPVALSCVTAMGVRSAIFGAAPAFAMPGLARPGGEALLACILIGGVVGVLSVAVTRLVYAVEDSFERLPIHWMWWPALGGLAIGAIAIFEPRTLGVGYDNIDRILGGGITGHALFFLAALKLLSWALSLGSGTSGGTLAPLFTIGGACGALLGQAAAPWLPGAALDPRLAGLVGMAAIFAGASRALFASVVFAFETTRQTEALPALLGGGVLAYLASCWLMRTTIMTEKITRRKVNVPAEYLADSLERLSVRDVASAPVVTLSADVPVAETLAWLAGHAPESQHQGFPVVDREGKLVGVLTRRDLVGRAHPPGTRVGDLISRPLAVIYEDCSLRQARDHMLHERVGRLPVVSRADRHRPIAMLTRSDLLSGHRPALDEFHIAERGIDLV